MPQQGTKGVPFIKSWFIRKISNSVKNEWDFELFKWKVKLLELGLWLGSKFKMVLQTIMTCQDKIAGFPH